MSIQAVAGVSETTGAAIILQKGEDPARGVFFKDADGHVSVSFDPIPAGPLVLVLQDGQDSRYVGSFDDGVFCPRPDLLSSGIPSPGPGNSRREKADAEAKAAEAKAAEAKYFTDRKAAEAKAFADKIVEEKKAADKAIADKKAADKAIADKKAADKAVADAKAVETKS